MNKAACPTSPDGRDSLGSLIGSVRGEIVRAIESDLAQLGVGLKFTQFHMLKYLALHGSTSASELARGVNLDAGAMTRQLDQLEAKGYLRRQPHEQDRRALRIELTEAGVALWRHLHESSAGTLERAQRDLSPEERVRLHDYLGRVLNALRDKD
ncbi:MULTISPECIES: MarR family transcriptional regulator [unclassified Luteibacter]|uniref:MarR family winged helix-turn-helix transcriptional regulator n=1 Tax=unclassified Luteibacter TaxID=2620188 RepID=UPI0008D1D8A5|nr:MULTISPECIES: MarR family transcriptional regulator [unclassified Luteibacter]MDR6937579.1 DNA-binding MarR family transcriptional regulator [Luteibacter sp. 3190]SEO36621.1 DNA-binding transcriptional regulator, MarR family [Luteibacter sp. UNC138MFCol5.1]SEW23274.1 DNA-binding transcriptional regulator, MarR family [Luteibacter sp. 329MFSha]